MAKNYIKRLGGKQVCELGSIAVFQLDPLLTPASCAARSAKSSIGTGLIEQGDLKTKSRQTHRDSAGTAPNIQSEQRPCRLREKILQIGQGEVEAQSALGRLEVGGVLRCASPEPFESSLAVISFMAPLRRGRPLRATVEYQSNVPQGCICKPVLFFL